MKRWTIDEVFTAKEFKAVVKLHSECDNQTDFHRRLVTEIVRPAMARIADATGQENDADYLAYALEYATTRI